jgi:ElaB/YqjD/DUF883 family membrane-anchored ribosome-binding protein
MAQNPAETHGIKTVDRSGSDAEQLYNEAKDAALEGIHRFKEVAIEGEDKVRRFIADQPYTAAVIALGLGLIVGYVAHREPSPPPRSW